MLQFPYAVNDFYAIISENYFYVDRTSHIPLIENAGRQLLFLRPRRFGKTLLLSMLENYYDVAKAEQFERLFGHLAIGQNPTPKHNQYFVMTWDFSNVSPQGSADEIQHRLYRYVNRCIEDFANYYQALLPKPIHIEPDDAVDSFLSLLSVVRQTPYLLYLLIDEYDHFANDLMMGSGENSSRRYDSLLSGEGVLKALFKTVKSATSGRGLERFFITGISPVVFSDMISGYNVAENIFEEGKFNDLCGFREAEIAFALEQIAMECDLPADKVQQALTMMKTFYDGYCFSNKVNEFIYNPTLALYFLKYFQQHCQFPRRMLDHNLAMDRDKIAYISKLPHGKALIVQALNEVPPLSITDLANRFGVQDMLHAPSDATFMMSLLYYVGGLTLAGETEFGELVLKIPNLVVRKLYVERIKELLLPEDTDRTQLQQLVKNFYNTGDLQAVCDFMTTYYFKAFDNRDYGSANELTIKACFLTVLFDDTLYIMDSELPLKRRYADLAMIVRPEQRHYPVKDFLLEFKYVSLAEAKLTGKKALKLSLEEVKALTPIQEKLAESKAQLLDYNQRFQAKYFDSPQLQLISVVALGFEQLVWEPVSEDVSDVSM